MYAGLLAIQFNSGTTAEIQLWLVSITQALKCYKSVVITGAGDRVLKYLV